MIDHYSESESRTNPDPYVAAQVSEMTATLRQLWLSHQIDAMKAGGPVVDATSEFDSWLRAIAGGDL